MTRSEKVVLAIHHMWCENWDVLTEFLGKEVCSSIEKEIPRLVKQEREETEILKELEWED